MRRRPADVLAVPSGTAGMTAGAAQAAAARQIVPAMKAFTAAARHPGGVTPFHHAPVAGYLRTVGGLLAEVISVEGAALEWRWTEEFPGLQTAASPDRLREVMQGAARQVLAGSQIMEPLDQLPHREEPPVPLSAAAEQVWLAVLGLVVLLRGPGRVSATVPAHEIIIAALAGACPAFGDALDAEAGLLESCYGELAAAFADDAAQLTRDGTQVLPGVLGQVRSDAALWRRLYQSPPPTRRGPRHWRRPW